MNRASGAIWMVVGVMSLTARAVDPALRMDPASPPPDLTLREGAKVSSQGEVRAIEFSSATQYATLPMARELHGADSATVTAWVYPRRAGE